LKNDELLQVLEDINSSQENQIDNEIIRELLSIVILNPLDDDRKDCQDQIKFYIEQKIR